MNLFRLIGLLLLALLVTGCMTEQDLMTQRKVMELQRSLENTDRTLQTVTNDQGGSLGARVESLARNQADFQAALDGLRVDVQSLQGRNDDLSRGREDFRQEIVLLRDELMLQIADLEQRIARLEEAAVQAPAPAPAAPSAPPAPAVAATPQAETASGLYEKALQVLREDQQYAEGRELMASFLQRYPDHPLAINAAYWIGEAFYAEKNYEKAILQFEDVIQKYGEHPKVAAALLKQGLAFDALGDRDSARLLLQRTVKQFPETQEATKAEMIMQGWKS